MDVHAPGRMEYQTSLQGIGGIYEKILRKRSECASKHKKLQTLFYNRQTMKLTLNPLKIACSWRKSYKQWHRKEMSERLSHAFYVTERNGFFYLTCSGVAFSRFDRFSTAKDMASQLSKAREIAKEYEGLL